MAVACWGCGKEIKGERVVSQPSNFHKALGAFDTSYHPVCYEKAEAKAAKELRNE